MRCIICKLLKQRKTLLSDYAYIIRKTEKRSRNLVFRVSVPTLIYNVCLVFKGLKSSEAKQRLWFSVAMSKFLPLSVLL